MNRGVGKISDGVRGLLMLITVVLVATGCATIIKGSDQKISFNTDPSEAKVVITDMREGRDIHSGSTPFTISLKRGAGYFKKAKYMVVIEKVGYNKEELTLEGTPSGWYLGGNLLFGGLIGYLIVDPATGAMWTLEPDDVNVMLTKRAASAPTGDGLTIALRHQIPVELEGKLKPVTSEENH